ncbi:MAG: hypothetical protein ACOVRM_05725 [Planctomycetaceae bacterium]
MVVSGQECPGYGWGGWGGGSARAEAHATGLVVVCVDLPCHGRLGVCVKGVLPSLLRG